MDTITAMVLEQFGQPLVRREIAVPALQAGEVLLRLRASGVCGSDLDIVEGMDPRAVLPLIPGHEGIGEIVALGGGQEDIGGEGLRAGDLVAFNRGLTCGQCSYCTVRRQPELCAERETYGISTGGDAWRSGTDRPTRLSGCYAEMIVLRAGTEIIKLPAGADPVGLVAATCSGATAAHAIELSDLAPGDTVVIIGPGPLGLYAAALAFDHGAAEVVMIGRRRDRRLELAEAMGCVAVSTAETALAERQALIADLTCGRGAGAVVDCAGTAESIPEALDLVAPGRTVTLPGLAAPLPDFRLDPYLLARKQVRLQGVWTSNARHLAQALAVAQSRRYHLADIVSHVLPLAEANEGLRLLREKLAVKVVLS
jgi:threonine dehydrogenase-like Zn-dependent dehydrogenase